MPVEIDETDLANYRQVATVMQQMLGNPQTRRKILEAQKILRPDAVIPELDAAKPVLDEVAKLAKRFDDFADETRKAKTDREERERLDSLKSRWAKGQGKAKESGYVAEGLTALEKFMEDNGVVDHEIAIPAFERLHPPAIPVAQTNRAFPAIGEMRADESMKMLLEDPDGFLNKIVPETLREVRGSGR